MEYPREGKLLVKESERWRGEQTVNIISKTVMEYFTEREGDDEQNKGRKTERPPDRRLDILS